MSRVTADSVSGVYPAVDAMKALLEIDPPKQGGFFQKLMGEKDLGTFGDNLTKIGQGFGTFNTSVANVNITHLTSVIGLIERLGTFANSISFSIVDNITNFGNAMNMLDSSDISMNNAITVLSEWTDDFAASGKEFADSMKDSLKTNLVITTEDLYPEIDSIIKSIGVYNPSFVSSGSSIIDAFIGGMKAKEIASKDEAVKITKEVINGLRNGRAGSVSAGQYLALGFVAGMNSKVADVRHSAIILAAEANSAFRAYLRINSPSKVMEDNGGYFGEGFIRGVQNESKNVEDASADLARSAFGSFDSAMDLISGVINNTYDLQPTIRPVIDLTDVQSGAEQISSIFSQTQTIGLGGYQNPFIPNILSQIGSNMNGSMGFDYVQNDNTDVIEAIRDLGNEFETIKDAISQMRVVMDSNALVGQIIDRIDAQLGNRKIKNERRI